MDEWETFEDVCEDVCDCESARKDVSVRECGDQYMWEDVL